MKKIVLSSKVKKELDDIYFSYLEEYGEDIGFFHAEKYVSKIRNAFDLISDSPKLGEIRNYKNYPHRKHSVPGTHHDVLYKERDIFVYIVAIRNQRDNSLEKDAGHYRGRKRNPDSFDI